MAAYAGVYATLGVGGTPTATTAEATSSYSTALGAAYTVRQITTAAKRCMDPSVAVIVYDGVTVLTEGTDYLLDRMYGKIRFQNYTPIGSITVDYTYIPILEKAGCVAFQPTVEREIVNRTTTGQLGPGGEKFLLGKFMASGTIENIEAFTLDDDPGGDTQSIWASFLAGTPVLLDTQHGRDKTSFDPGFRTWVFVTGLNQDFAKDGIVKRPIRWKTSQYANNNATFMSSEMYL